VLCHVRLLCTKGCEAPHCSSSRQRLAGPTQARPGEGHDQIAPPRFEKQGPTQPTHQAPPSPSTRTDRVAGLHGPLAAAGKLLEWGASALRAPPSHHQAQNQAQLGPAWPQCQGRPGSRAVWPLAAAGGHASGAAALCGPPQATTRPGIRRDWAPPGHNARTEWVAGVSG